MPFDVEMPDGTVIQDVPDGTTKAQVLAKYNAMKGTTEKQGILDFLPKGVPEWMQSKPGQGWDDANAQAAGGDVTNPMAYLSEAQKQEQGAAAKLAGQVVNRGVQIGAGVAKGAVINPATAVIESVMPAYGKAVEETYQTQRKNAGAEGFDWAQLAGGVVSPVNKLVPNFANTATVGGRILQGVGTGVLAGAVTPTGGAEGEQYVVEKLKQMGLGGLLGGGISGGVEIGSKLLTFAKEAAKPFTSAGRDKILRDYFDKLTGGKGDEVIASLRGAEEYVAGSKPTAAEAVANVPEATALAAYQQQVSRTPAVSGQFAAREAEQAAARQSVLQEVGQTPEILELAKNLRAQDATRNYGEAFATAIKADPKLIKITKNPYIQDALPDAIKLAEANGITAKTDLTEFLHYVKLSLDKQLTKTGDTALSNAEKSAVAKAKGELLGWMSSKNPAYENARASFAAVSQPINEMEIVQHLQNVLQAPIGNAERAAAFATAVNNQAATIKKASGAAVGTKIEDIVTPKTAAVIDNVMADLERKASAAELARKTSIGSGVAGNGAELPHVLSRAATVTNSILRLVRQGAEEKINTKAAELLLDPAKLVTFMESIPAGKANTIVGAFMKYLSPELRDAFTRTLAIQGITKAAAGPSQPIVAPVAPQQPVQKQNYLYPEKRDIEQQIRSEAEAQGIGQYADLLVKQANQESKFDPFAVSNKGASGIFQLMPTTARELGVQDTFNTNDNIRGGVAYMKKLLEKYNNNPAKALAAYNWGTGRVDRHGMDKLPPETKTYLRKILGS